MEAPNAAVSSALAQKSLGVHRVPLFLDNLESDGSASLHLLRLKMSAFKSIQT